MPTLYYTLGLPASGKSSVARDMCNSDKNLRRVNKDSIRAMILNGERWKPVREKQVIEARNILINAHLEAGRSVIVDDTNFGPSHVEAFNRIAAEHGAVVECIDLTYVPYDDCVLRDSLRENPVGADVIRRMWSQFILPQTIPTDFNMGTCLITDMDGTLASMNGRSPYSVKHSELMADLPRQHVIQTVNTLALTVDQVFVFSARKEEARAATSEWLCEHTQFASNARLILRPDDDNRKDVLVKREMYEEHIKNKYSVFAVFDDRPTVCRMWKELGMPLFDVGDGYEF